MRTPPLSPTVKHEAEYLALFASAHEKVRGEASVSYFWDSASPSAIKRACPDAKILVILRDPVERAHSHFWHAVRYGQEARSFRDAVEEELSGHRRPGLEPYVRRSLYAKPLELYLDTFGDNLHIVFFEDMLQNTREVLRNLFCFLDIDCNIAGDLTLAHENRFALPRGPARLLIGSAPVRRIARLLVPTTLRPWVERLSVREGAAKPPIEPETRILLARGFSTRSRTRWRRCSVARFHGRSRVVRNPSHTVAEDGQVGPMSP